MLWCSQRSHVHGRRGVLDDEVHHNIWFQDEHGEHRSWTAAPKPPR